MCFADGGGGGFHFGEAGEADSAAIADDGFGVCGYLVEEFSVDEHERIRRRDAILGDE